MSASEAAERFAEEAPGEEMPAAKRVGGIDGNDVEVAAQPAMLEAVVEHDDVGASGDGGAAAGSPVAVGDVPDARDDDAEFGGLVALLAGPRGVCAVDLWTGAQLPGAFAASAGGAFSAAVDAHAAGAFRLAAC